MNAQTKLSLPYPNGCCSSAGLRAAAQRHEEEHLGDRVGQRVRGLGEHRRRAGQHAGHQLRGGDGQVGQAGDDDRADALVLGGLVGRPASDGASGSAAARPTGRVVRLSWHGVIVPRAGAGSNRSALSVPPVTRLRLLAFALVSRTRTERLVNLVICLLSTRRFLTAAQIAATVPGYEHDPEDPKDHEAFQRKFERDKAELRDLGVPLEIGTASVFDNEPGYRIAHREYALPDILLEPDEAAAVGIAARLWQHAGLAAAASSGLAKLRAAGVEVDPQATLGRGAGGHGGPGVRPADHRGPGPPRGIVRLPGAGGRRAGHPPPRAVGRGVLAGPVVRGGPRPGPRRRPAASGCPGSSATCASPAGPARSPRRPTST